MKKLLFALPLLMLGCAEFKDAANSGIDAAKDVALAPAGFGFEALQAVFRFLASALGAFWDMFINKFLPF